MIQSSPVNKEEFVTLHLSLNIFGFQPETRENAQHLVNANVTQILKKTKKKNRVSLEICMEKSCT